MRDFVISLVVINATFILMVLMFAFIIYLQPEPRKFSDPVSIGNVVSIERGGTGFWDDTRQIITTDKDVIIKCSGDFMIMKGKELWVHGKNYDSFVVWEVKSETTDWYHVSTDLDLTYLEKE